MKYCYCSIWAEATAVIWFDEIITSTGPTIFYTLNRDSQSTIGSHLVYNNITSDIDYNIYSEYIDGGGLTMTTLNTVTDIL